MKDVRQENALLAVSSRLPSSDWKFERTFLRTCISCLNHLANCTPCACLLHQPVPKSQNLKFSPTQPTDFFRTRFYHLRIPCLLHASTENTYFPPMISRWSVIFIHHCDLLCITYE
jgi:hypothetical protein